MLEDSFFFSGLCFCKHLHFKLNSILHVANCVLPPNAMQYMMQMNTQFRTRAIIVELSNLICMFYLGQKLCKDI